MTDALTAEQVDELGEVANISMGNAATTLSMMVNHRVDITTPNIQVIRRSEALDDYEKQCVMVHISFIKGLTGNNMFVLKQRDVMVLTDLMMGGTGQNVEGELTELHLSAVSESMNQMMGTSATSLSTMLETVVDISTPNVTQIDVDSVKAFEKVFESQYDKFVKISFRVEIEDLMDSTMVQLYPIDFAREICKKFEPNRHLYK